MAVFFILRNLEMCVSRDTVSWGILAVETYTSSSPWGSETYFFLNNMDYYYFHPDYISFHIQVYQSQHNCNCYHFTEHWMTYKIVTILGITATVYSLSLHKKLIFGISKNYSAASPQLTTVCSMTIWAYNGIERRNLSLSKVMAIAVPPRSHEQNLGAWQSTYSYNWLQEYCSIPPTITFPWVSADLGSASHLLAPTFSSPSLSQLGKSVNLLQEAASTPLNLPIKWRLCGAIPEVSTILEQPQFNVVAPKMAAAFGMVPRSLHCVEGCTYQKHKWL